MNDDYGWVLVTVHMPRQDAVNITSLEEAHRTRHTVPGNILTGTLIFSLQVPLCLHDCQARWRVPVHRLTGTPQVGD